MKRQTWGKRTRHQRGVNRRRGGERIQANPEICVRHILNRGTHRRSPRISWSASSRLFRSAVRMRGGSPRARKCASWETNGEGVAWIPRSPEKVCSVGKPFDEGSIFFHTCCSTPCVFSVLRKCKLILCMSTSLLLLSRKSPLGCHTKNLFTFYVLYHLRKLSPLGPAPRCHRTRVDPRFLRCCTWAVFLSFPKHLPSVAMAESSPLLEEVTHQRKNFCRSDNSLS